MLRKNAFKPNDTITMTSSLFNLLVASLKIMAENAPVHSKQKIVAKETKNFTLYTDASVSGFGFILISEEGELEVGGERWDEKIRSKDISTAELSAVYFSLSYLFSRFSIPCKVKVFVDNTSALCVLQKKGKHDSMRF